MIRTVLGDIQNNELGITMSHEHLCIDLSRVRKNTDSTFGKEELIIDEINKASAYNVKSYVEVSCNDMGRDPKQLAYLSEKCNVNIIAATGYYLDEYHPDDIRKMNVDEIANIFIKDIQVGMDNTSIRAGVIGEVATSEKMSESEKCILEASAIAANKVGCAITTHCQLGLGGLEQIEIFEEYKVNPSKVILGHIDLSDNIEYMTTILEKGYNIGFDTIGKEAYLSDEQRANNLLELVNKGYSKQIVLSQDISRKSYFENDKGYEGYQSVMKTFIPLIKSKGINQEDIDNMLIYNPQRIFDIS